MATSKRKKKDKLPDTPRTGRTPDLLRKGGPQRDKTKYHRPTEKDKT